jgi:ABC-type sugar transport system substrate-binding protein
MPLALAITAMVLAACGGNGVEEAGGGAADDEAPTTGTGAADPPVEAEGDILVGFAMPTTQATYFTAYIGAVEERAAEMGVSLVFAFAENDADRMNQQMNDLLTAGVDVLVVAPVDVDANAAGIEDLRGRDTPIITSNRFVNAEYGGPDGQAPQLHIGFSDYEIGRQLGEMIVDVCADVDPCRLIIQEGSLGSSPQIERTRGIEDVIADEPNIEVIDKQSNDFQQSVAIELTEQLLTRHSEIDVIVTHDDASAVGVVMAVEEAGRDDEITVIGIGGSIEGTDAIEAGRMYGTVWVSPRLDGTLALEAAVALARGDRPTGVEDVDGRPTVPVPIEQVTSRNVRNFPGEW